MTPGHSTDTPIPRGAAAARGEEASRKRVDEWSDGFEQRFGLYRVDFDTKRRTPKLSASFYRETIARNAVA